MTVSVYDDRRADDRESQRVYLLPWRELSDKQKAQVKSDYPNDHPDDYAYTVDYHGKVIDRYSRAFSRVPPFDWRAK